MTRADLSEETTVKVGLVFKVVAVVLATLNTIMLGVCAWVLLTVVGLDKRVSVIEASRFTSQDAYEFSNSVRDQLITMERQQDKRFDIIENLLAGQKYE